MPDNFWLLLIANLPLLAALFWALQKKWIIMGVTFTREMEQKDKEIAFRELLRQEVLEDKANLEATNKEIVTGMTGLAETVKQTLDFNERLLDETLNQRWDQVHDRRAPSTTGRAR